jgi:hypothetical protein
VGFLGPSTAALGSQFTGEFEKRLSELGRSVAIEYGWADGKAPGQS